MDQSTQSPDVAALLAANPEAAHFLATLAQGTPLAEAVRDHFGPMLAEEAPAQAEAAPRPEAPVPAPAPAPPEEPAVPFAPPAADAPDDAASAPAFLSHRRRSFWPDDFTL